MSECTHDCSTCSQDCSSRKESFREPQNPLSNVKKVIGIVSGKGGVGKSMVTSLLAVLANRKGLKTAILDADITGPSVPKAFGLTERAESMDGKNILPVRTKKGIKVMSINLLLEDATQPVIWRGPILAGVVKQFWTDVVWDEVARTMACLDSFNQKLILIAGGYDKGVPFTQLGVEMTRKVKTLVLCGATAPAIRKAVEESSEFETCGIEIVETHDLAAAVAAAQAAALPGDIVVLSPACAAFDQFKNFMERGKVFKQLVHEL
ncbi:MAG: P-loop NTPase [Clostridia bacterium]|nr:P-loop NTPase [Clostridia bacterium]